MTLDDDSAILTLPPSPPESLAPGNLGLSPSSSPPPILLGLTLHPRSRRVLHLEPMRRAPRAIRRVLALRHDTFNPHLARMGEDGRAVALGMLVEPDAAAGLGHDRCERGLADLKRIAAQVVAVQFDQVEAVEEYALVSGGDG